MDDLLDKIAIEQTERWDRAARKMPVSSMSDSKWRKALTALGETNEGDACEWKFVFEEDPVVGWIPRVDRVLEHWIEPHCLAGAWGVVPRYEHLEWLELLSAIEGRPYKNAPVVRTRQDLESAEAGLRDVAKFDIERTDRGLRIYGYRRVGAV